MKKFLNKINQYLSLSKKNSVFLKDAATKSYGRTMLETLAVLAVLAVLTFGGMKGLGVAFTKSRVNKILDDASEVHTVLSMSKKINENWILVLSEEKSRSGLNFLGKRTVRQISEDSSPFLVSYVRVTLPQKFCEGMLENQSTRLSFYKASPEGDVSTKPLTSCEDENDMIIIFNMANACTSDKQCIDKYGKNYICMDGFCSKEQCQTDDDCDAGEYCVAGACRSEAGCTTDNQCAENHICLDGVCTKMCAGDSDCAEGQKCDINSGVCSSGCSFDTDCPDGYRCAFGTCVTNEEYSKCKNNADCPNGAICLREKCVDTRCEADQYWNSVQEHCMDCPVGATCDTNGIVTCPTNQYISGDSCLACPINALCDGISFNCNGGTYDSNSSCCLNNYACCNWNSSSSCCSDQGHCTCQSCCSNWNSEFKCCKDSGCSSGEVCENGYVSHGGHRGAVRCCHPTQEYWNGDNCAACPEGCTCDGTNSSCYDSSCPGGSKWNGIQYVCCQADEVIVKAGKRSDYICCPKGTSYAIDRTGYTTSVQRHQDYVCAGSCAGSECCGVGKYVDSTHTCQSCPSGATCDGTDITNCGSGKYKNEGNCESCPSGATCDGVNITSCGNGYLDGDSCRSCPSGATCDGTNVISCASNQVEHTTSSGALRCCTTNQYWSDNTCKSCPSNATCNGTDKSNVCADGYTSHTNSYDTLYCCNNITQYWTGSRCKLCPSGTTCDGTNANGCASGYTPHDSPSGSLYCCSSTSEYWNGSYCSPCPSYATCDETGIASCGPGKYLQEGGSCYYCPSGATCDGENVNCGGSTFLYLDQESNTCKECPSGAICDGIHANCGTNKYLNNAGTCSSCPTGGTCDGTNVTCTSGLLFEKNKKNGGYKYCCNTNQYWNGNGCANCPSGATCEGGHVVSCGSGKYKNGSNSCTNCPSGATCDGVNVTSCGSGKYRSGNACYACPDGSTCDGSHCPSGYTPNTNSMDILYCCSSNQYWTGSACASCPDNVSCDGTGGSCQTGYTSHISSSGGLSCCNNANQYWISNTCRGCPGNATCNGTNVTCNTGYVLHTYAPNKNNANASDALYIYCCDSTNQYWSGSACTACPNGGTCDGTYVTKCVAGKYWNGSSCANCPDGATCDGTNLPKCANGWYWASDRKCRDCEELYRRGAYDEEECLACGTRQIGENGYCDWSCPLGWFRNANGNCTRCFNTDKKQTSKEECDKCDYPGSPHVRTYYDGYCEY